MIPYSILRELVTENEKRIVLLVMDGLGGLPIDGKTALEAAYTPNMDTLARESSLGLAHPIDPGITPGSGPAHLALFGYDPLSWDLGRGVLECLGVGLELENGDVAIRGNFCRVDDSGIVVDRRAGRIGDKEAKKLCEELQDAVKSIGDVEVTIRHVKEHRLAIRLRGSGLEDGLPDTDPQVEGKRPVEDFGGTKTGRVLSELLKKAREVLKDKKANYILLRGISKKPELPLFPELFKLKPLAIATYPMYKGIAKLVGMEVADLPGESLEDQVECLRKNFSNYNFFYFHVKKTDSYGEDGNFAMKIRVIEEVDKAIPRILDLNPDVLAITGDHSTPSLMKSHSFHPVPFLIYSLIARGCGASSFSERECARGDLGIFHMKDAMQLLLAHAMKLKKFGA